MSLLTLALVLLQNPADHAGDDWPCVGGDRGWSRYSTLDQINRGNVKDLEVAWSFSTGELEGRKGKTIECTPLVIGDVMYVTTAYLKLIALEAATGRPIWSFDPLQLSSPGPLASGGVNRGVAWWSDGEADGERRVLHGVSDGRLFSLDARTGLPDPAFGENGAKDLREDLDGDYSRMPYGPTSAPAVCGDVVVLGFSCGEGPGPAAPGDVRAFDVRTGRQLWRFHTVPRPDEFGHDTWEGDSWKDRGAANAWGGVSVDVARGMVFAGLGSAAFDFYGGDRKGQNLFANCVIALDAQTGQRRWHFQTLRHDLWDHDLPVCPSLVTVNHDGRQIDAVAQVTKTGYLFLFDRETGRPLFEVEERSAPRSDVPGEESWPTQPVPVRPPPFCRTVFTEDDVTDLGEATRAAVLEQIQGLRFGQEFTPPSLEGTIVTPGFHGGATWSGASFDPDTDTLYVNANNLPNVLTLVPAKDGAKHRYGITGYHKFLDPDGHPAVRRPWGTLTAIDLKEGTLRWQSVLGSEPGLDVDEPTGTENFGGCIVTAGGLVFIGATRDEQFHAFDKDTGELLWQAPLPAGGYATPCTYAVSGRQYVVIAAGGAGKPGTRAGDQFIAFSLPEG